MDPILERAALWGIETRYQDAFGRLRTVEPEMLVRLLGAVASDDAAAARMLPRTIIVRGERDRAVAVAAAEGQALRWEIAGDQTIAEGEGAAPSLTLPPGLPTGLFRLRVTAATAAGRVREEASLVVCPDRAYQGDASAPRRMWALAVQLYSVRSARNWGHGDFTDLLGLVELAADLGASGVGLNPLHALFDDRPSEPSPYFPNSRLFLNPLYIDLDAVPEFPGLRAAGLEAGVERLRGEGRVDYRAVADAKTRALRLAYGNFRQSGSSERRDAFDRFRRARGSVLLRFACFELLRRKLDAPWWEWPPPWRRVSDVALAGLRQTEEAELGFFEFVQWLAHEQLDRCRMRARERGLAIGLYLDIAVGVRRDGFDAWCDQDAVLPGMAIGAPPDALNRSGQNWGLAAVNPVALEARYFEPFRRMLQASMQYAGAIRLDHVLGLKRLFLVPDGVTAEHGAYIRCPFEALLAVTALSSVEASCIVIGEDLGTVPEQFRETLTDWGIWSYQVMLFERLPGGAFAGPDAYRENALVTFATHDLPTYAGWREKHDLAVKHALGIDPGESGEEREGAFHALHQALVGRGLAANSFAAVGRYLADAPSRLLVVSIEDLLGVKEQVNLPGTVDEHPNWRHRLPIDLDDLRDHEGVGAVAEAMRAAGRSQSRG
ncbi:MAG: 4-alpha-glucanotransferase [Xanthobacteraceae bacterium]|jgi:4-alpha-glucanotransferase